MPEHSGERTDRCLGVVALGIAGVVALIAAGRLIGVCPHRHPVRGRVLARAGRSNDRRGPRARDDHHRDDGRPIPRGLPALVPRPRRRVVHVVGNLLVNVSQPRRRPGVAGAHPDWSGNAARPDATRESGAGIAGNAVVCDVQRPFLRRNADRRGVLLFLVVVRQRLAGRPSPRRRAVGDRHRVVRLDQADRPSHTWALRRLPRVDDRPRRSEAPHDGGLGRGEPRSLPPPISA